MINAEEITEQRYQSKQTNNNNNNHNDHEFLLFCNNKRNLMNLYVWNNWVALCDVGRMLVYSPGRYFIRRVVHAHVSWYTAYANDFIQDFILRRLTSWATAPSSDHITVLYLHEAT